MGAYAKQSALFENDPAMLGNILNSIKFNSLV